MAKISINGEVFEFDYTRKPMSEALAIENALKMPYAQYEQGLADGSAKSIAGLIWLVWRRAGRDVSLDDILSGKVDIDLAVLDVQDDDMPDPTSLTPAASSSTGGATSGSSPKSSTSGRGRSASSTPPSSKR